LLRDSLINKYFQLHKIAKTLFKIQANIFLGELSQKREEENPPNCFPQTKGYSFK
jgi:hypothetical protein